MIQHLIQLKLRIRHVWLVGDRVSIVLLLVAGVVTVGLLIAGEDFQKAIVVVSLALAVQTGILLVRLNTGLDRQQRLEFDPVTREVFRNLKDNVKLADRLHRVDVSAKENLGRLIAGKEDAANEPTILQLLFHGHTTHAAIRGASDKPCKHAFLESGSTLAYLGLQLTRCSYFRGHQYKLSTNNVLLSLTFLFKDNTTVNMLDGTPRGQYGATFGTRAPANEPPGQIEEWRRRNQADQSVNSTLHAALADYTGSRRQFDEMREDMNRFLESDGLPDFIVMTTSRFSVCDGPHVGSLQNRDFKENLACIALENKIPILMLIYEEKIDAKEMNTPTCLSVFGRDARAPEENHAWSELCKQEQPELLGIATIANWVARGVMTIAITSEEEMVSVPNHDPLPRPLDGSGALFQKLKNFGKDYVEAGTGIDLIESRDRRVRVFTAAVTGSAQSNLHQVEFVKTIRHLLHHGYHQQPVTWREPQDAPG